MSHHEHGEVTLRLTAEQARALNASITYYQLWLESHPEQQELRKDLPHLRELGKEVNKQQTAQSPHGKLDRFAW